MWLNLLVNDCQYDNITKLENKTLDLSGVSTKIDM